MTNKKASYFIFKDSIVVNNNGKTYTVSKAHPEYQKILLECLSDNLVSLEKIDNVSNSKKLKSLLWGK